MTSKHWTLVGGAVACAKSALITSSIAVVAPVQAQNYQADLAFPGYSGFLNVPSAIVLHHGQADVQWSDQAYLTRSRKGSRDGRYGHLNNVSGVFGIFPYVELGGRLTWEKTQTNCYVDGCVIRDLASNIKVQAPLIPENWFSLAVGIQDVGGETDDFDASYIVAGKHIGPVELAVGYGAPETTPRYLDGAF
uniref:YjbH domain-containing protein n=1 Tax=Marinobacter sediminum TaxID=256323 RepID=UPI0035639651